MINGLTTFEILAIIGALSWLYPIGFLIYSLVVKPRIRISPAETIQIGYTTLGPVLNIQCAISSERKTALVERIEAKIKHEKGDSHVLTWKFLDETQSVLIPLSGEGGGTVSRHDVAIALKVDTTGLSLKNIGFQDDEFHQRSNKVAQPLYAIINFLHKEDSSNFNEEFLKSKEYNAMVEFFKNNNYWQSGKYVLELHAHVVSLSDPHVERFEFQLMQHEIDNLKKNIDLFDTGVRQLLIPTSDSEDKKSPVETWNWVNPKITRIS